MAEFPLLLGWSLAYNMPVATQKVEEIMPAEIGLQPSSSNSGRSSLLGSRLFRRLFGFLFEWIGDEQLKRHLADESMGKSKFIKTGLWRYTRHPNYFGEAVLWWGIYLLACSVPWGFATVYAPLFITLLIRYVSGVPFLEAKYESNPEF